nr:hypothetical protein [Propionibacterium sp.]
MGVRLVGALGRRRVVVSLLLDRRLDGLPVVDLAHLVVDEQDDPVGQVVEDDDVAVHAERDRARLLELVDGLPAIVGVGGAVAHVGAAAGPGQIAAAAEEHRRGRRPGAAVGRRRGRGAAGQRRPQVAVGARDQHPVVFRAGLLQDELVGGGHRHAALSGADHRTRPVEHDQHVAHHGEGGCREICEALDAAVRADLARGDPPHAAVRQDDVDDAVDPDDRPGARHLVEGRLGVGGEAPHLAGRQQPHLAGLRVGGDRDVAAVRQAHVRGDRRPLVEGQHRGVDVLRLARARVVQHDRVGVLAHVEVGGAGPDAAVQRARRVVEVGDEPQRLVRHPDAAVVQLQLGGGDAGVQHGQHPHDQRPDQQRGEATALPTQQSPHLFSPQRRRATPRARRLRHSSGDACGERVRLAPLAASCPLRRPTRFTDGALS